jgi:DNA-binding transcriptional LysR family regulator
MFDIVPPADSTHALVKQGEIDLAFLPEQMLSENLPSEFLFEEGFLLVGCKSNPIMKQKVSEEAFYEAGQVVVQLGRVRPQSIVNQNLKARRRDQKNDVIVTSFLLAPEMIIGTDRLTIMHERLAKNFASRIPIAIAPIPFSFPPLRAYIQYHEMRADDPGTQWLIGKVREHIN